MPVPRSTLLRFALALTVSVPVATAAAPAARAECSAFDRLPDRTLNVGYAFLATVVEASDAVDPPRKGSSDYTWHVELRVDRVFRGRVPGRLVFNGWGVGCHSVRGNHLNTGDRVVIAVEELHLRHLPTEPFSGDTVVWREARGGWHYARKVVGEPEYPPDDFSSLGVRRVRTMADIVAIVRAAGPPDTSVAASGGTTVEEPGRLPWPILTLAGLLGLLAGMRRSGLRQPLRPWRLTTQR